MTSSLEALVSTVAAAIAAVAALAALVIARKTLAEARATTTLQNQLLEVTDTVAKELGAAARAVDNVAARVSESTKVLHQSLAEQQAGRELDQLVRLAEQLAVYVSWRRSVRQALFQKRPAPWHEHNDAQAVFVALLEGLPAQVVPKCRAIAQDQPNNMNALDEEANHDVTQAIRTAEQRLRDIRKGSQVPAP